MTLVFGFYVAVRFGEVDFTPKKEKKERVLLSVQGHWEQMFFAK